MTTRVQRDIASVEAAFGAAVADLAALLERAGAAAPYDDARAFIEGLQHDGWRYRPREHAPSRRPSGSHIPAAQHAGWQKWRDRTLADLAQAQAEFEAREAGRLVVALPDPQDPDICPECAQGKCGNCTGKTLNTETDEMVWCGCGCHK